MANLKIGNDNFRFDLNMKNIAILYEDHNIDVFSGFISNKEVEFKITLARIIEVCTERNIKMDNMELLEALHDFEFRKNVCEIIIEALPKERRDITKKTIMKLLELQKKMEEQMVQKLEMKMKN